MVEPLWNRSRPLLWAVLVLTSSSPTYAAAMATAQVTVQPSTTTIVLTSNFTGLSYEKERLPNVLFSASDTALIALFKRLGPSLLRVGGSSVDTTHWDPHGAGLNTNFIAPSDIDRTAGFLRETNWKILYGINLGSNTIPSAVNEAVYAYHSFGSQLYGFEIGNEVDNYPRNGTRPSTYTYADFRAEWEAYAAAIHTALPNAVLTGPAAAGDVLQYVVPFSTDEAGRIKLLTEHYYRADGHLPTSTMAELLAPDPALRTILARTTAAPALHSISGGYRLSECNSYYNGGTPGISNAFGTALWAIDFLFEAAEWKSSGVNFHGGGNSPGYTPIADDYFGHVSVRPEFYGLQVFAMMANGNLMDTQVTTSTSAFSAYAVARTNGTVSVVLNNKDSADSVSTIVSFSETLNQASAYLLTASSLLATAQITFGGVPINDDGSWTPTPLMIPIQNNELSVIVPPASALLIQTENVTSPVSNLNPAPGPLSHPKVYPNPWRADAHDPAQITFTQIPADTVIRIFTVSGHQVVSMTAGNAGTALWNLQNNSGQTVASGLYLYTISDNQGDTARGKLAIIR